MDHQKLEAADRESELTLRRCQRCKIDKPRHQFRKSAKRADGLFNWCRVCSSAYQKEIRAKDRAATLAKDKAHRARWWGRNPKLQWARMAHIASRSRARRDGLSFNLTVEDIYKALPDLCPVFRMELAYVRSTGVIHEASPTLDRVRNDLGYEPGNIVVVSFKANRMKSNATLDDLERVLAFYRSRLSTPSE